jgi:hypothetical protein
MRNRASHNKVTIDLTKKKRVFLVLSVEFEDVSPTDRLRFKWKEEKQLSIWQTESTCFYAAGDWNKRPQTIRLRSLRVADVYGKVKAVRIPTNIQSTKLQQRLQPNLAMEA